MAPRKAQGDRHIKGDPHEHDEQQVEVDAGKSPEIDDETLGRLCRERICPECEQLKDKQSELLRALADAENYKKRLTREKEEYCKYANESLIEELLPVLDNLELALVHGSNAKECQDLMLGVRMTLKIFLETLGRHGLIPVGEEDEPFDPNVHEAVGEAISKDIDAGRICQLMQKGYRLKDRLVRPARVMVSKKCE